MRNWRTEYKPTGHLHSSNFVFNHLITVNYIKLCVKIWHISKHCNVSPAGGDIYCGFLQCYSKIYNRTLQKLGPKMSIITTAQEKKMWAQTMLSSNSLDKKIWMEYTIMSEQRVIHSIIGYLQLQRQGPKTELPFSFLFFILTQRYVYWFQKERKGEERRREKGGGGGEHWCERET